ncbi:MAG: cell division protein FtsW [Clostridia bacterium]|nr:cell division protein FtsW [Clostridia bacterium]
MDNKKFERNRSPEKNFDIGAKLRKKYEDARRKRLERQATQDVIFSEPITPVEQSKPAPLAKGGIDICFLLIVFALLCFGAIMSYSASSFESERYYGNSAHYFIRHLMFIAGSICVTIPVVLISRPWFWRVFGIGSYAVSVLLLLLVLIIGTSGGGAQRWIQVGPITIQPSEIAKMAIVLILALVMSKYESKVRRIQRFDGDFKYGVLIPGGLVASICLLVALEKHISGLMIIGMIGIAVMFLGGTRLRWILMIIGIVGACGCLLILVSSYAQVRVNTWLHINEVNPLGEAWQTLQGLNAIGSGGFFGRGLGNSVLKSYVSEPQNDFIFTILCEELGFFGAALAIGLFCLLIWRGFKIAKGAPDRFCSLVVYGLTLKTALQALMNIAVVTNSMPNTGIALPFFSAGGTSLMIQIFEMGIILSISRYSSVKK